MIMKQTFSSLKRYLRWLILGGTLFFLVHTFITNWSEVKTIQIHSSQWLVLAVAFVLTFIAYIWSGWVWYLILRYFHQPAQPNWVLPVHLKTNIAKYLPGNVWHFYGRIWAMKDAGSSLGAATLSVMLEPLLMAAAASLVTLAGSSLGWMQPANGIYSKLPLLGLGIVLLAVHPRILNPIVSLLNNLQARKQAKLSPHSYPSQSSEILQHSQSEAETLRLESYPLIPLLGELFFVLLRGAGFLCTLATLTEVSPHYIPVVFSAFSFAWLLGLVVPTPGGLGIFETTTIALLNSYFSTSIILSVVALFRVLTISTEATAAGLGWAMERSK